MRRSSSYYLMKAICLDPSVCQKYESWKSIQNLEQEEPFFAQRRLISFGSISRWAVKHVEISLPADAFILVLDHTKPETYDSIMALRSYLLTKAKPIVLLEFTDPTQDAYPLEKIQALKEAFRIPADYCFQVVVSSAVGQATTYNLSFKRFLNTAYRTIATRQILEVSRALPMLMMAFMVFMSQDLFVLVARVCYLMTLPVGINQRNFRRERGLERAVERLSQDAELSALESRLQEALMVLDQGMPTTEPVQSTARHSMAATAARVPAIEVPNPLNDRFEAIGNGLEVLEVEITRTLEAQTNTTAKIETAAAPARRLSLPENRFPGRVFRWPSSRALEAMSAEQNLMAQRKVELIEKLIALLPKVGILKEECTRFKERYCCSISLQVMREPVTLPSGHNYENAAIRRWIAEKNSCPKTRMNIELQAISAINVDMRHFIGDDLVRLEEMLECLRAQFGRALDPDEADETASAALGSRA